MQSQIKGRVAHSHSFFLHSFFLHSFFLHSFFLAVTVAAQGLGPDPQKDACLCKLITAPHKGTSTAPKYTSIRKHTDTHSLSIYPHTHTHTHTHKQRHSMQRQQTICRLACLQENEKGAQGCNDKCEGQVNLSCHHSKSTKCEGQVNLVHRVITALCHQYTSTKNGNTGGKARIVKRDTLYR